MLKSSGYSGIWSKGLELAIAVLMIAGSLVFVPVGAMAQDPTEADASVRFVHASPDAPAVDVLVDGAVVAEGLTFGQATDYLPVSPDEHQVQVTPSGTGAESAVIDTTFDPEGGKAYIVAASGLLNEIESKVYDVHQDDLDVGKSRLRMINLSPDSGNVDVYVTGGDELIDDLEFGEASDYTELDAATYDLDIRPHDDEAVDLAIPGFVMEEGNAYDVLLTGQKADQSLAVLSLATSVEAPCSDVLGVGALTDACVRVVHASPDAPAVDIYVNDSLVIENLAFGAATDFAALPAGYGRNIKVVSNGSPVDDALIDEDIDLSEGQAYQIVVADMVVNIDALVDEVDLSPEAEGQARIRVIHAAPDVDDVDVVVTDGPELFGGVGFKDVTDYQTIDAGTYDIQVKEGDNVVIRVPDLAIESGMVYDLLATGREEDGSLTLVALTVPAESPSAAVATPEAVSTPVMVEETTPETIGTPAG